MTIFLFFLAIITGIWILIFWKGAYTYKIEENGIVIIFARKFCSKFIPFSSVVKIEKIRPWKVFGFNLNRPLMLRFVNGGASFFVQIETDNKRLILITPSNQEEFIADVQKRLCSKMS
jgi:hypothetical protein